MSESSWNKEKANIKNKTHDIQGGEKKVMKKSLKVLASATLAFSLFASVAMADTATTTATPTATTTAAVKTAADFTDLASATPAQVVAINALLAKGYMEGKTDTTFDITGNMTRAEAAKLVAKIFGLTVGTETTSTFKDVDGTDASIAWSIPFIEAAKKAGIIDGMTDTTFAPKDNVTIGQLAALLVKGFGKGATVPVTTPWYDGYLAVVKAAGIDLGTDGAKLATRADLVVGSFAADQAVQATKKLTISSVKQVGAKKIAVTFGRAVTADELTKLTTTVKNGFVPYNTTATLSADKLSVVLESTFAFPTGEYTVEVAGYDAQKVTVAAEVASKVEIGALALQNTTAQNLVVKTTNQFGEEIASAIPDTNISVFDATYAAANPLTVSGGKVDLTNTKVDDNLIVTATHVATGLSATKSFKVVSISSATTMTFGPATPLKDKTKITINETGLALTYSLKDQYGTSLNLPTTGTSLLTNTKTFGDITFSTSSPTVVNPTTFAVDADGKLTFTAGTAAGTAIITAVNAKTGAATSFSIKVEDVAKVKTYQLNHPGILVAASEDVKIPFMAVDSFGTAIANKDFANTATNSQVVITSSNPAVTFVSGYPKYDAVTGELVVKFAGTGTTTVYAWIGGAIVGQVTLDVKAAAAPVKVTGLKGLKAIEAIGGSVTVDIAHVNVVDTYGRPVTALPAGYTLTLAKKAAETTPTVNLSGLVITAASAGTTTLVIGLDNSGAVANSTFEYTNTVVADTVIASYSIASVGETVYGYAANTDADLHAKAVTLVGKDASGNEIAIAQGNYITAITSSNATIATIVNGKIVGLKVGDTTVTAWKGGTKLAELAVKVSDVAPVVATAAFGKATYTVASPTVAVPTPTVNLGTIHADFLTVKDQYGIAITPAAVWTSSDTAKATVSASGVVTGKAAGTVTISYVTSNGVVATTQVVVTP